MKTIITAGWMVSVLLTSCSQPYNPKALGSSTTQTSSTSSTSKDQSGSLLGRWQLEQIIQNKITIDKPVPYDGYHQVQLVFGTNGTLDGTSSTNSLTYSNYKTIDSDVIVLTPFYEPVLTGV